VGDYTYGPDKDQEGGCERMMLHAYKLKIPQPIPTRRDKIRSYKRSKTNDKPTHGGALIDHDSTDDVNDNNHDSKNDDNDDSSDDNSVKNGDHDIYDKVIHDVYESNDNDQICEAQTNGDVVHNELSSKHDFNDSTEFLVDVTTEDPFVFINGTLVISSRIS
jgi:hypothetical protein